MKRVLLELEDDLALRLCALQKGRSRSATLRRLIEIGVLMGATKVWPEDKQIQAQLRAAGAEVAAKRSGT